MGMWRLRGLSGNVFQCGFLLSINGVLEVEFVRSDEQVRSSRDARAVWRMDWRFSRMMFGCTTVKHAPVEDGKFGDGSRRLPSQPVALVPELWVRLPPALLLETNKTNTSDRHHMHR